MSWAKWKRRWQQDRGAQALEDTALLWLGLSGGWAGLVPGSSSARGVPGRGTEGHLSKREEPAASRRADLRRADLSTCWGQALRNLCGHAKDRPRVERSVGPSPRPRGTGQGLQSVVKAPGVGVRQK